MSCPRLIFAYAITVITAVLIIAAIEVPPLPQVVTRTKFASALDDLFTDHIDDLETATSKILTTRDGMFYLYDPQNGLVTV